MNRNQLIWSSVLVINLVLVYFNQSTWDDGDSILHYLEAHQAWSTPSYFMNMWSKPVFILLASPFAVWGWWGMKLFNVICAMATAYLTKQLFNHYGFNGWWGVFLSFFAYSFFLVQSSGLTEPLFMLGLTAIVYLEHREKTSWSLTILSFLPFVRSEGYIIALVLLAYLLITKKWKHLPFALIGTFLYGIAGIIVFNDFLWMFHQNPYAGTEVKYGSGPILHFLEQLPYLIGLPIFVLFFLGVYRGGMLFFKGKVEVKELFLIYGITLGYISAHSIFWAYGMFHSFGMSRVLVVIIPLISFIAYRGLEWLFCAFHFVPQGLLKTIFVCTIIIFPFTKNKMGLDLPSSVSLSASQLQTQESYHWINEAHLNHLPLYSNDYYLAMLANKKINMKEEYNHLNFLSKHIITDSVLVIWDSYFATTDAQINQNKLESDFPTLNILKTFQKTEECNREVRIYVLPPPIASN